MDKIDFQLIKPNDHFHIDLIATWYLEEWNIPKLTTIQKLTDSSLEDRQFQVLLTINSVPVATGGIYNKVGLLNVEPRFNVYKNWLALVYSVPAFRNKGYGASLCNYIQKHSKEIGLPEIYLFTHTAENLYLRIGWEVMERLELKNKQVVVMKKEL